ncbi:MAG: hypothetical protein NTZ12_09895 [Candidatus Aminicenantes bacterium]|nr:hypothetical protein [Candidatus Aminicenantes bacterium]
MAPEKNHFLHWKFNLQTIFVLLAALVTWAIIGGWYIALAPANMAGPDNFGVVISILGLCLFLSDRLAYLWLKIRCQILVFTAWLLGLALILWGLVTWLRSFSRRYIPIFVIHWALFLIIIVSTWLWVGRRRGQTE